MPYDEEFYGDGYNDALTVVAELYVVYGNQTPYVMAHGMEWAVQTREKTVKALVTLGIDAHNADRMVTDAINMEPKNVR